MKKASRRVEAPSLWTQHSRLIVLVTIMLVSAGWFGWYRVYRPTKLLEEAKAIAPRNLIRAEQLAATAANQSIIPYPEAQLFHCFLLGHLGRWDEALEQFTLIKDAKTLPAKELCAFAAQAQQHGQNYIAAQVFTAAKHDQALRPQILRSLIQIHLINGQEERAKSECDDLLKIDPKDATAWQVLGTISMNRKDLTVAEQAFQKCLEISEDNPQRQVVTEDLIQVLIDMGNISKAHAELETLREQSDTLSDRATLEEAWILRVEGKSTKAIEVIQRLLQKDKPTNLKALLLRGLIHSDLNHHKEAIADLDAVVKVQPWNKEAHNKLAILYTQINATEQAAQHRAIGETLNQQALDLLKLKDKLIQSPGDIEMRKKVAELYVILGQPEQARRLLGKQK